MFIHYKMKSGLSGDQANNRQWDTVILKKKPPPKSADAGIANRVLTADEMVDRQKTITPILRQNIQKARLCNKMSQQDLANASSLNISVIKEYETGRRIFNETEVKKLEKALKCVIQRK